MQPYRRNRPKTKSAGTQPKIPAQKPLVIHYLPTLALSKSGSGLKRPAYSQPACASTPFMVYDITFVMICILITALLYTPVLKMQVLIPVTYKVP
jgi:hypothetical protein